MNRILIIDDDEAMRGMFRARLEDKYSIVDTGVPEQALALALEHKPDAILLDLMMPNFSGFELCRTFTSLSFTQAIPIVIVSGEAAARYKSFCQDLGATSYFEKPVNFDELKNCLKAAIESRYRQRRSEVRIRLRVILTLKGTDANGAQFEMLTTTDDVSTSGFRCGCAARLHKGVDIEVYLAGEQEQHVGRAHAIHAEWADSPIPRYGFRFVDKPENWVLQ